MKYLSRAIFWASIFCLISGGTVFSIGEININIASLEDLMKIVHIGEARALELVSLRPFSSLDDLLRIKGIGEQRLKDIKNQGLAYVETPTTVPPTNIPAPQNIEQTEIATTASLTKNSLPGELAAIKEQIPPQSGASAAFLPIAIVLAILSGGTILVLKKTLK